MKKIFSILGILSLVLFSSSSLLAVKPVNNTIIKQEAKTELTEKQAKKLKKLEQKIAKRISKSNAEVDFDDPVDKWMWFWIFAWGLGLAAALLSGILSIGIFGFISTALFVFGFVALVLWLVKKFS